MSSSSSVRTSTLLPKEQSPVAFTPENSPNNSSNDISFQEWQTLFKRRRAWAISLADGSRKVVEGIEKLDHETSVVRRCTAVAVENIKQHVGNLHPKYEESKTWADQICDDQKFLLDQWGFTLEKLASVPAFKELGYCIQGLTPALRRNTSKGTMGTKGSLRDFVDTAEVQGAEHSGREFAQTFSNRVSDLRAAFDGVATESNSIIEGFQQSTALAGSDASDQAGRLMEEMEVLARKINADYEHILGLPETQKSLSQISKTAQLHKNNFLPSLIQTTEEVSQLLSHIVERKDHAMKSSIRYLQEISMVESTVSSIHSKLANLDLDDEIGQAFNLLNFVVRLPAIYGSLLVECVRRGEWTEKMTTDSSSLVEEMATYKEEEARRRKKWIKDMAGAVDLGSLDDMALGIEVNLQAQKHQWPTVNRADIADYVRALKVIGGLDDALKEVEELTKTLDTPSRQQARRAKAFKNGSVHEAAYGRTSLLLRGDDDVLLAMRNEKSKADDKLKSAESRIRKLEDLLHRQSQFPRPLSAAGFPVSSGPTFERYTTSPVTNFSSALSKARESGSRRSSVSSRRLSANKDPEEKGLAQRVVSLEAELIAEKAQSADLEKTAAAKSNAEDLLKSQVREAISIKEDLLGNMEAQQREFDDERHLLDEEISKLKLKLEELEDELDRAFDTREHEDKIRALEEELDKFRRDAADEVQAAHGQTEYYRDQCSMQSKKADKLEGEFQQHNIEKAELNNKTDQLSLQLQNRDQAQLDHHRALRASLLHLSPDKSAPEDFSMMIETIETVAEKSATHLKDIQDALGTLRADKDYLETRVKSQGDEIYDLRERLGSEEREVFSVREELSVQQTHCTSLQSQLDFERNELEELKRKLAGRETNAEALRDQLLEGERTIADLLRKITDNEAQHQTLEHRLVEKEAGLEMLQEKYDNLSAFRDAQATRAYDVSKKLHSQNINLERLLEQIGLTATNQDGTMIVQKLPKATSASTVLVDPSMSMKRSLSGTWFKTNDEDQLVQPKCLHWADAENLDAAQGYFTEFMKGIAEFQLDVFNEAIYKRVKEIEHIARKWQKEARSYREKSHRAQTEAHERITLRNFKEGDLALFLPTRDQATKPWAAFNVGAPHCFLREQDSQNLGKRDYLIARISKVEERVVDLSKSINGLKPGDHRSISERSDGDAPRNEDNPYELSDGLRWYLIDAAEEKPGAPINLGVGKVTVASANVDAKGSIRMKKPADGNGATKTLTRSLDSRRSSTNSKKGLVAVTSNSPSGSAGLEGMFERSIDNAAATAAAAPNLQAAHEAQRPQDAERPQSSRTLNIPARSGQIIEQVGIISAPDW